jgi:hypothetical protein
LAYPPSGWVRGFGLEPDMSDQSIINPLLSEGYAKEKEVTLKLAAISSEIGHLEKMFGTAFDVHKTEHEQLKQALDMAANVLNDKLVEMNQFRAQIDKERLDYVRRDMLQQSIDNLHTRIDTLENSIRVQLQSRSETFDARFKPLESMRTSTFALIAAAVIGLTVLGLALRYIGNG